MTKPIWKSQALSHGNLYIINYIREQVDMGLVDIQKIAGEDNMADLHTKPLRYGAFERYAPKILGEKRPASSLHNSDGYVTCVYYI